MIKIKYIPLIVFILASCIYLLVYEQFNLITTNYIYSHFLFGFFAPLFFGYFPIHLLLNKKNLCDLTTGNFKELNLVKPLWSLFSGVLITLVWSIGNEVFTDPSENENSFFNAWEHLAYDLAGVVCISVIVIAIRKTHKIVVCSNKT